MALERDGEKMLKHLSSSVVLVLGFVLLLTAVPAKAQIGNSGSIDGVVKDPSGGVIAGATVEISYPVSGYQRQTTTGSDGAFHFTNVPFNGYHLVVTALGFGSYTQDVDVRSTVPVAVQIGLKIGAAATSITVEANGGDLIEKDPSFHTDVDTALTDRLPLESQSSSVSSLVTLATPGVVADSNQSLEAVSGGPPAEYGDKTSLVIKVTTRSGLGVTQPTGSVFSSYGSFGSVSGGFRLAFGGQKWGN